MLQSLCYFHGCSLDPSPGCPWFCCIGKPRTEHGTLDMASPWLRRRRAMPLNLLRTLPNGAQNTTDLLCWPSALAIVQYDVHQEIKVLLCEVPFYKGSSLYLLVPGVVPLQEQQDFKILLVELLHTLIIVS